MKTLGLFSSRDTNGNFTFSTGESSGWHEFGGVEFQAMLESMPTSIRSAFAGYHIACIDAWPDFPKAGMRVDTDDPAELSRLLRDANQRNRHKPMKLVGDDTPETDTERFLSTTPESDGVSMAYLYSLDPGHGSRVGVSDEQINAAASRVKIDCIQQERGWRLESRVRGGFALAAVGQSRERCEARLRQEIRKCVEGMLACGYNV